MGLLRGMMGHASEVDTEKLAEEFAPLLCDSETVVVGYRLVRDLMVFTDRRLLLVDIQGATGLKKDYQTIPYDSIHRFSKESTGVMDLEAELKLWIRGQHEPIVKLFKNNRFVNDAYKALSEAVLAG